MSETQGESPKPKTIDFAELYKKGLQTFLLVVHIGDSMPAMKIKALNLFSLYSELLVLLPNFGVTDWALLNEDATEILANSNLGARHAMLDAVLGKRIVTGAMAPRRTGGHL